MDRDTLLYTLLIASIAIIILIFWTIFLVFYVRRKFRHLHLISRVEMNENADTRPIVLSDNNRRISESNQSSSF